MINKSERQYEVDISMVVSIANEDLENVTEIIEGRVSEMCYKLEHGDDVGIHLLRFCTVKKYD